MCLESGDLRDLAFVFLQNLQQGVYDKLLVLLFGEELNYLLAFLRRDLHVHVFVFLSSESSFWHHVLRECFLPRRFKLASCGGFSVFWGVGSGSGVTLGSSWQDFAG